LSAAPRRNTPMLEGVLMKNLSTCTRALIAAATVAAGALLPLRSVNADETCNSPYMRRLITGQEQFIHVWTLGVSGVGDGSDKLVTVDVDPKSPRYGKVLHSLSVGGQGEVHHMGFTDDRKFLWAGRLDDSKIFIFDVGTNPAAPRLVNTITDFESKSGFVGPHTFYALPGRMLIGALSNTKDRGGRTGMAVYNNRGQFIGKHEMPLNRSDIGGGDGYGYDIAINPRLNAMLTSSFTGWNNYMMDFGTMLKDPNAMKQFGQTMVLWNHKSMEPKKVFSVPGAPLEIRWGQGPDQNWAITATALTSRLWLIKPDERGEWQAMDVGPVGDPAKVPLPVDMSIAASGKGLWVNTFLDGTTRYFDISTPTAPREVYQKVIGKQVNMVSQSYDGRRVYFTSSLTAKWDKQGADDEQFLKAFEWNGQKLVPKFELDFMALGLGRAHHMKFSARSNRKERVAAEASSVTMAVASLLAR
jgi:methanethiol oxidase